MAVLAYQSDRVEDLVERLIVELERDEARRSSSARDRLFLEHLVVIPTRNLETYLTLEIAARRGVATGVRFVTIQRLLSDLLPLDDAGEPRVEILDQASLTRLMVSVFSDEALLAEPEMRPVQDFLYPDLAVDEDHERRRFQLAFRVARLFEDYGYSRRSLLDRWSEGKSGLDEIYGAQHVTDAHREIEAWQRRAWQALFGDDGVLERDDTTYMTLPAAIYAFADELSWPEVTHVFGQSYLPRFFRDLFSTQTYEESRQINFYVMNPCLEHWSHGVAGDRDEDPVFDILGDSSLLSGDEYPMALELWGRAGRDFQRLLDEVTYDRVDLGRRDERDDDTLLRCFQAMIRDLKTDREVFIDRDVPIDESLHFWSMPGIQRECEAIASEIWELVTTREDLRFNDIAVVVQPAERTVYQSHLRAAFERTGSIPCNVIDVAGEQRSPFLEAARLLLDLPLGSFRRRELLSLLVHPCVLLKYPEVSATDWMHWCDELNIFQAAGREDLAGTYLQEERFTWEQGLRRLVLGSFMSHSPDERPEPFALNGEEALVLETGHEKMESVGTFVGLVEDLIQGARAVRGHRRSLARWMEHFRDEITRHLRPRDRREERTRMRLLGRLQEIADGDLCPDDVVGYRTAFDFAATAMSEMEETLGQYLADGVVVSAFKPMRPIPFEVVFVTGLGENRFPAPDPPEMLDLRQIRSRMHDVNPRHRDLYLFLETLMSTRSRLYLSWVGRHGITGDALEPASVVYQLQEMILSMTPLGEEHRSLEVREALRRRVAVVEHPLRRYHESYFPELFGEGGARALPNHHAEAYHEARIRALRRELPPEIASYRWTMKEIAEALSPDAYETLARGLKFRRPDGGPQALQAPVVLQISQLRRFLECPLQGSARALLRLYDENDEDLIDAEHEPFEADFLQRLMLLRDVLEDAISRPQVDLSTPALARIFDEHTHQLRLAGELPAGVFFEAERRRCVEQLQTYVEGLKHLEEEASWYRRLRLGSPPGRVGTEDRLEPVRVQAQVHGQPVDVEIHGMVAYMAPEGRSFSFSASGRAKVRSFLQGALDQVLLRAAGIDTEGYVTVITRDGEPREAIVECPDSEAARKYLGDLAGDLLSGVHDYLMPVEVVAEAALVDDPEALSSVEELVDDRRRPGWQGRYSASSQYGPVRRWQDAPTPTKEQIVDAIQRRFEPLREIFFVGEN